MQLELVRKIAWELKRAPDCELKIVGLGEPALHPSFEEILEILKPVAPRTPLYTNGVLFMKMTPEALLKSEIRHIIVSIDGTDQDSFDRHRPGGDYERIWKDTRRFHEIRIQHGRQTPSVEIRHVIHPSESSADLANFWRRGREVSDTVKFNYVIPIEREKQLEARPFKKCRDIYREMYVEWDGRVPLCGYVSLHRDAIWIGNAASTSLKELWKHPELEQIRANHKNKNYAAIDFCKNCEGC
jgi:MoaA/NifB/PqqE/SkfB family radical SAM enzyme